MSTEPSVERVASGLRIARDERRKALAVRRKICDLYFQRSCTVADLVDLHARFL